MNQIYDNWSLCIVDDASTNSEVAEILRSFEGKDKRIKVIILDNNQGVSVASNEGINIATGDFIGFLDHDDELTRDALFEVVKLLNDHSETDFIYSDELIVNTDNLPIYAYYKTDFSLDYFLSHPYIVHFVAIRASLVREVSGFRKEFAVSQDYDFFLRIIAKTNTSCTYSENFISLAPLFIESQQYK